MISNWTWYITSCCTSPSPYIIILLNFLVSENLIILCGVMKLWVIFLLMLKTHMASYCERSVWMVSSFRTLVCASLWTPYWEVHEALSWQADYFPPITYNWINQLSNTTIWWLDISCLLYKYQLHVSALTAIFRLTDWQQTCKQLYFGMRLMYGGGGWGWMGVRDLVCVE